MSVVLPIRRRSSRVRSGRESYEPAFWIAAGILALLVLATVVARLTRLGGDPNATVGMRLAPPGSPHALLGTDNLGRSLLPRLLQGIGTTLLLSSIAVLCTAAISTAIGIVAGYRGGRVAELILRIVDVLYSFPAIILAILVAAVVGPGQVAALASIVLVTVPLMTRMVGAGAASVVQRDFVRAAVISGVGPVRIMVRHVLSNVSGTVAIQGTYALSVGILVEGALSFLGYGVQLPHASLGLLIQEGSVYMVDAPWLIIAPGCVLVLAILAINVIGDSLRDRFEPRETRRLT